MEDVSKNEGRTVLFVSHNMQAIQDLCTTGILLNHGKCIANGPIKDIIHSYINNNSFSNAVYSFKKNNLIKASALSLTISDQDDNLSSEIPFGKPWKITIDFIVNTPVTELVIGLGMLSILGTSIRTVWQAPQKLGPGRYTATFIEDTLLFSSGTYKLLVGITERGQSLQYIDENILLTISNAIWSDTVSVIDTTNGFVLNPMKMKIKEVI